MTSRRELLQSGLAASAAALLPLELAGALPPARETVRPEPQLFIFDERFPEAVAASQSAKLRGIRQVSVRQVYTSLWYDELDLAWQRTPGFVAGATTERTLHTLETLALDRRMRVTYRTAPGEDGLISWTIGPAPSHRTRPAQRGA